MIDLTILHPPSDPTSPLRFGSPLGVVVDITLDVPWVELSYLGSRLSELDGEAEVASAYETRHPVPVKALASGRIEVRDSGKDDHSGPPPRKGNSGRGCEVIVRTGSHFEISYSHLKRGAIRAGLAKAGEAIGQSGNSGRCLNGAKSAYVKIAVRQKGSQVKVEDLIEPIFVESTINGVPIGNPKKLPPGELVHKGLVLDTILLELGRDDLFKSGETELVVTLRRGSRRLAQRSQTVYIEW